MNTSSVAAVRFGVIDRIVKRAEVGVLRAAGCLSLLRSAAGLLGEAFLAAGFSGTAQVDLGIHEHDHRAVRGETGLAGMSTHVASALAQALSDAGIEPEFAALPRKGKRKLCSISSTPARSATTPSLVVLCCAVCPLLRPPLAAGKPSPQPQCPR